MDCDVDAPFGQKLDTYLKSSFSVEESLWKLIDSFAAVHLDELKDNENLYGFCKCVTEFLLKFDCPDLKFIARIVDAFFYCNRISFFDDPYNPYSIESDRRLEFILGLYVDPCSDYGKQRNNYVSHLENCLKLGDIRFMTVLSKYNFIPKQPCGFFPSYVPALDAVVKFGCYMQSVSFEIHRLDLVNEYFRSADFLDRWDAVSWKDSEVAKPSYNRMNLVLKCLNTVVRKLEGDQSDVVSCYRLLFEVVAEPYVTLAEMRGLVKTLCGFFHLEDSAKEEEIYTTFAEMYPESGATYMPRTLAVACKCELRNLYQKYGSLPVVVNNWFMPARLRRYLLCDTYTNETDWAK